MIFSFNSENKNSQLNKRNNKKSKKKLNNSYEIEIKYNFN